MRERIYEKWDDLAAVSFLTHDGGTYQLAPYEAITEDEYWNLKNAMSQFDENILEKIEIGSKLIYPMGKEGIYIEYSPNFPYPHIVKFSDKEECGFKDEEIELA